MQRAWAVTVVAVVVHAAGCDFGTAPGEPSTPQPAPVPAPVAPAPPAHDRLAFAPLELAPPGDPQTTATAWVGGAPTTIGWSSLLRVGVTLDGTQFGRLVDHRGAAIQGVEGECGAPDFNGLLPKPGGAWWLTHFECQPGAVFLTDVAADATGALTAKSTRAVDFGAVRGTWVNCAGSVTPWGTHLASEEYEPNARGFEPGALIDKYWANIHRYFGGDPTIASPYSYGWMPEITVAEDGASRVTKHYAMGRFSHEIGVVMPDRRTVYMTDDARGNGGLFMFVADEADDLSAGHLYAARLKTTSRDLGGRADVAWIDLGHAMDGEVAALLGAGPRFDRLFDAPPMGADGTCPEGSRRVHTASARDPECLTLREGASHAASRLETRRFAAYRGATTELVKGEGLAYDDDAHVVYIALSAIVGSAAGDGPATDDDHLSWPTNPCGGVYALDLHPGASDTAGHPIDSAFVASHLEGVVLGRLEGDRCAAEGIANPDNLAYLPGHRALMIAEDTRGHDVAMLWHFDTLEKKLTRVHTAPAKAEVTGIAWYPDIAGHGYLAVTHQTDGERPSEVGYLGPFPKLTVD